MFWPENVAFMSILTNKLNWNTLFFCSERCPVSHQQQQEQQQQTKSKLVRPGPGPGLSCGTAGVCSGVSCACSSWDSGRRRAAGRCCGRACASSGRTSGASICRIPDRRRASLLQCDQTHVDSSAMQRNTKKSWI